MGRCQVGGGRHRVRPTKTLRAPVPHADAVSEMPLTLLRPDRPNDPYTGTYVESGVRVPLGGGNGAFEAARNFAAGSKPSAPAAGDFDDDGWLDLAVSNSGGVGVLFNDRIW